MKIHIGKKRSVNEKQNEVEEELYTFDDDDDDIEEDEEEPYLNASDIEDQQADDDIPDQKAWGKKRVQFYDADFVDKDYSTYTKEEEDLALAEEEEAQEIQRRLAQQLNEVDFDLEIFGASENEKQKEDNETQIKVDFNNLDARQKLEIFKKESPEFEGLVNDFEINLKDLREFYFPLMDYAKTNESNLPIFKILESRINATNFYLTNLAFYLYMKVKKQQIKGHPVVKKLAQIKQLLIELDNKIENFRPQLQDLLERIERNEDFVCMPVTDKVSREGEEEEDENDELNADEENEEIGDERRGITYEIAKNKGLTPHRKKENRNPRVKHRSKFRKALIRRKGAVRTVRKELKRYDGEISGIKATVRKSIKLK